jgi:hypothetical protein
MVALHNAAADCGSMQDILSAHSAKVGWHILRIHRERNWIVHRANPWTNVSTLIVNLNEYILHIFDTFFELAEAQRAPFTVDELFSEISIIEDARQHELLRVRKNEIDQSNAALVLGLLPRWGSEFSGRFAFSSSKRQPSGGGLTVVVLSREW